MRADCRVHLVPAGAGYRFEKGISELVVRCLDTRGFILTSRIELASWNANQRTDPVSAPIQSDNLSRRHLPVDRRWYNAVASRPRDKWFSLTKPYRRILEPVRYPLRYRIGLMLVESRYQRARAPTWAYLCPDYFHLTKPDAITRRRAGEVRRRRQDVTI